MILTLKADETNRRHCEFYSYAYEMGTDNIAAGLCVSLKYAVFSNILNSINLHESQQGVFGCPDGTVIYSGGNQGALPVDRENLYYQETDINFFDNKIIISDSLDSIDWKLVVVVNHFFLVFLFCLKVL